MSQVPSPSLSEEEEEESLISSGECTADCERKEEVSIVNNKKDDAAVMKKKPSGSDNVWFVIIIITVVIVASIIYVLYQSYQIDDPGDSNSIQANKVPYQIPGYPLPSSFSEARVVFSPCLAEDKSEKLFGAFFNHPGDKPLTIVLLKDSRSQKKNDHQCVIGKLTTTFFNEAIFLNQENSGDLKSVKQDIIRLAKQDLPFLLVINSTGIDPSKLEFLSSVLDDNDPYLSPEDFPTLKFSTKQMTTITLFEKNDSDSWRNSAKRNNWSDRLLHRVARFQVSQAGEEKEALQKKQSYVLPLTVESQNTIKFNLKTGSPFKVEDTIFKIGISFHS